jgi:hypothetical protein
MDEVRGRIPGAKVAEYVLDYITQEASR